jgi:DNA-binding IscR family transcriptional regulator
VVAALEGLPSLSSCEALGAAQAGECDLEPICPIRSPLSVIREGIWGLMERTTLRDLVESTRRPARVFSLPPATATSGSPESFPR